MKFPASLLVTLVAGAAVVDAGSHLKSRSDAGRHARLAHRAGPPNSSNGQSCPRRSKLGSSAQVNQENVAAQPAQSSSSSAADAKSTSSSGSSGQSSVAGLLNVKSSCGSIGATKDILAISGPNGNIGWLNCGVDDAGWRPPYVQVSDIITVDLSDAVKDPNTPFGPCKDFVPLFEKYAKQFDVPPILMAAFAMQESTCNPNTVGGAGEQGLMQLTKDKCGKAPGGNCKDPDYNIRTGTQYFSDTLKSNGGSLLKTIGTWNGWFEGMTESQATNAPCCRCQKNLDYLHQFLNGWVLNIDAYDNKPRLGKYFNLDKCGSTS